MRAEQGKLLKLNKEKIPSFPKFVKVSQKNIAPAIDRQDGFPEPIREELHRLLRNEQGAHSKISFISYKYTVGKGRQRKQISSQCTSLIDDEWLWDF